MKKKEEPAEPRLKYREYGAVMLYYHRASLYAVSSLGIFSHELTLEKQLSHGSNVASSELM